MQKPAAPQKTVLETILDRSRDRPLWQRDALRRIIANGRLTDADIGELVDLCKQGKGAPVGALKAVPLEKAHLPANPGQTAAVSLLSITDVTGVNNLAVGQTLGLEPNGITIFYGDNGAGKSGYARILKRACRARHAGKIEPNVYADQPPKHVGANIAYGVGGVPQPVEQWQNDANPHATLSAVSVFDSDCASVHIREKNEVAFRPFGLDVPDELAAACQAVKDALAGEQKQLEKARNPIFAAPTWKATTAVGKALAALNANTDVKKIEALAALSADESARLERLREDLSKNPTKAAAEQTVKADNVMRLITVVNSVAARTTDEELLAAAALAKDARSKRDAARLAAEKAFTGEPLAGVGGETWRALWDSARRYSTEIAYPGQPFPPLAEDAYCMLCQQPLEAEARARMARFEDFIQKDTEQLAREAEKAAQTARQTIAAGAIGTRAVKASLDELRLQNEVLQQQTRRFIAAARLRRHVLLKALGGNGEVQLPPVPLSPLADLSQLQTTIRNYAAELRKSADADERKKLETDFAELSDRALLAGMLPVVTDEIQRLKTIRFLTECAGDTATNTITKMGNDIADTVITPRLRDRFQEEIVRLGSRRNRALRRQVRLTAVSGAPLRQAGCQGPRNPERRGKDLRGAGRLHDRACHRNAPLCSGLR